MVKLTEDMIVARTRVSDMNHVKKLNCWGAELSDITVLRKLTSVEVLSLSVNTINTLSDIQNCKNLQELYIRKNQIPDISEICWIKDLPRLKNLWLEENPCAEGDQELYRQTVIRNIPQLQKLDNVAVTSEEMADAMRRGIDLDHPLDGGSDNQSARLKVQVQRQEPQEDNRRMSRNSGHEQQEYEQPQRRESIQSPSRRVSNQVWPEEREATHTQPGQQRYEPAPVNSGTHWDEDGYGDAQTEYSRTYSSNYETGSHSRQREVTPDEGMRRHSVREESRYQTSQQQQQRPQRSSYSGPPSSDGYYRGQEVARPVQEYSSQQSQSRATTPGDGNTGPPSLASQGKQLSRAGMTPVREGLSLSPLSLEGSSLALEVRTDSPFVPSRDSSVVPSQESSVVPSRESSVVPSRESSVVPSRESSVVPSRESPLINRSNTSSLTPSQEGHYNAQAIVDHHYEATYREVDQQLEGAHQLVAQRALSPQRPYPIRPKNRNSNMLSAILCLIKEIDGPSLEVVEMAVRCRMEELED